MLKLSRWSLIAGMAVVSIVLGTDSLVRAQTLEPGSLIKASTPAVYYYSSDGKRYVFPDEKIFKTWYENFDSIVVLSDQTLAALPIGGAITSKPGSRMVKIQTDPKVYAVARGGVLRWITSEQIAKHIYGPDWSRVVNDIADTFFTNYRVGAPILSPDDYSPYQEFSNSLAIGYDLDARRNLPSQCSMIQKCDSWSVCSVAGAQRRACWSEDACTKAKADVFEDFRTCGPLLNLTSRDDDPLLTHTQGNDPTAIQKTSEDALMDLFGLSLSSQKPETLCEHDQSFTADFPQTIVQTIQTERGPIPVTFYFKESSQHRDAVQRGFDSIALSLPKLVSYFGEYPCNNLAIVIDDSLQVAGLGSAGLIFVPTKTLLNENPDVLNHELTHAYTYYGDAGVYYDEGVADLVPNIIKQDLIQSHQLGWRVFNLFSPNIGYNLRDYFFDESFNSSLHAVFPDSNLRICDTSNFNNLETIGDLLFRKAYILTGQTNMLHALKTLYEKHRITAASVTPQDVYKTLLYFTPSSAMTELQGRLKTTLCQ